MKMIKGIEITIQRIKLALDGVSISDKFFIFLTVIGRFLYLILSLPFPFLRTYLGKLTFPFKDVKFKILEFNLKIFCRKHFDDIITIDPTYEKKSY
ncbi:MAG: hypothetical protein QW156_01400 [Candidatus Aenigmatarchaeota archaeon]